MAQTVAQTVAPALRVVSSMATRAILQELVDSYCRETGAAATLESLGGVEVACRLRAGENFDVVVLADDALQRLEQEGYVTPGSRAGFALSPLAIAVREGAPLPALDDEAALRKAVLSARTIGYSTGPSGDYFLALLKKWGVDAMLASRLRCAPPGIPVATLLARGEVELGVQQLSELMGQAGVSVAGRWPAAIAHDTRFACAIAAGAADAVAARMLIAHLTAPASADGKRSHGMEPV